MHSIKDGDVTIHYNSDLSSTLFVDQLLPNCTGAFREYITAQVDPGELLRVAASARYRDKPYVVVGRTGGGKDEEIAIPPELLVRFFLNAWLAPRLTAEIEQGFYTAPSARHAILLIEEVLQESKEIIGGKKK